jgi:hypothetical protein
MIRSSGLPIASASEKPKITSAPRFHTRMTPCTSATITASSIASTTFARIASLASGWIDMPETYHGVI